MDQEKGQTPRWVRADKDEVWILKIRLMGNGTCSSFVGTIVYGANMTKRRYATLITDYTKQAVVNVNILFAVLVESMDAMVCR